MTKLEEQCIGTHAINMFRNMTTRTLMKPNDFIMTTVFRLKVVKID